jgi:cytochrome P450
VWTVTDAVQLESFDEDSYYRDPLGFFARLRESRPVAPVPMPGYGRAWIVTRYTDVRTVAVAAYDDRAEHQRVERELAAYFAGLIAARRSEPGDDLVSALACDSEAADGLTGNELVATVFLLVMAGFDTTVNLIASGTLALLTHPGEKARLQKDPSLLPAAVEELLRFTNPVNHANDRFTTEDVPVGDVVIPAGEWVFPAISSANRDPAQFPDPDRLDLGRDTSGHVAFGHGVHHCLGAPLARMEAEVALGALLACFPRISLAVPPEELRWRPVSLMNGLASLPVRLT